MTSSARHRSLRLNTAATAGSSLVRGFLAFLVSLVITRGMTTEGRGAFGFITNTTTVLLMLAGLGIGSAMTRAKATGEVEPPALYRASLVIGGVVGAVASGVFAVAFLIWRESLFSGVSDGDALAVVLVVPPLLVLSHWTVVSYLDNRIVELSGALVTGSLLYLVSVAALGAAGELGVPVVVAAWASTSLVPLVLLLRRSRLRGALQHRRLALSLVRFGLRSNVATVALVLVWRADVFLVKGYRGLTELAMYAIAVGLCEIALQVAIAFRIALTPMQGDGSDRPGLINAISLVTRLTVTAGAVAAAAVVLLAEPVVVLLYGERYAPAATAVRWLVPGIVALVAQGPLVDYLLTESRVRAVTAVTLVALVINIALNVLLLPDHTFVVAAIASTATYVVSAGLLLLLFVRVTGVAWRSVTVATRTDVRALRRRRKQAPPA